MSSDDYGRGRRSEKELKERLARHHKGKRPLTHDEEELKRKRKDRRKAAEEKQRQAMAAARGGKGPVAIPQKAVVQFDTGDWNQAVAVGKQRFARFDHAHGSEIANAEDLQFNVEVVAPVAEKAVALKFGLDWLATRSGPSKVGGAVISGTKYKTGKLILHKESDPRLINVQVVVDEANKTATMTGWVVAGEAMKPEYWGDPFNTGRPAFWIPQSDLNPMGTLTVHKGRLERKYVGQMGIGDF